MTDPSALSGRTPAATPGVIETGEETKRDRHLSQVTLVREAMKVADDFGVTAPSSATPDSATNAETVTTADAERLTTRIQLRLGTIADNVESVMPLIEQAKNGNVHEVLGYRSWTEYVSDRFGGTLARIGKAERVPIVELLSGQGMSTRAIATVVGVSKDTVSRDLRPGVSDETPAESMIDSAGFFTDEAEMRDAFVMADATPDEFEVALAEAKTEGDPSRENVVSKVTAIKKIAGIDGKTYTRPEPKKASRRRRPLPDAYWHALCDLQKSVERLERLHADDRFLVDRKALHDREWRRLGNLDDRLSALDNDLSDSANKCDECDERLVPGEGDPLRNRCSGGCG